MSAHEAKEILAMRYIRSKSKRRLSKLKLNNSTLLIPKLPSLRNVPIPIIVSNGHYTIIKKAIQV